MAWVWILIGALAGLAGLRHRSRLRSALRSADRPRVDDAAIEQILREGSLAAEEEEEPLDLEEVARAEEEFWSESWDDPERFEP